MRTRNSYFPNNSSATIPRRQNKRRIPNVVKPELRTIVEMADNRTMKELLQVPTEGVWYDKEPPNLILTWEDLVNKFVNQFFPPSKTTHLKNQISRFTQRFEETFKEAWERFKEMLRACLHHGFMELAQIDTFYNGLNDNDQDSLNATAYASKSYDRIDKLADQISTLVDIFAKKIVTPAPVKAVEESCVTCGGNHAYYNCPNIDSNQPSVCVVTGTYNQVAPQNCASNYMAPPGFAPVQNGQNRFNQNLGQGNNFNRGYNFQPFEVPNLGFQNPPFQVLNNSIQQGFPNEGDMKAITTRSGVAYEGPLIPTPKKVVEQETKETTDKEQLNFQGSNAHIQPLVNPIPEPDVPKTLPKLNLPYHSRLNDQNLREKAINKIEKFFQIFQDFHFDVSFADALLLMPKFTSTIKSLLTNKDKLFELAKIPLNENCSAMLLKKLPEKLGDPGKFLIPCDFTRMDMTLEVADRSITCPKGVAEDVFVKVGKFHFLTDFVVVDFEADPRVPLILGISFLRTSRALIDVYGEEITLQGSDFILEEIEAYVKDDSISLEINHADFDPERDIYLTKNLLNDDPLRHPQMDLKEVIKAKSLIEEPLEVELKDLPSHLEYAYLEENDKLPTSGQVEVSNRGLKCILERTVGENCASWSDKLDDALWAFRTTFKTLIGCTPYKLTAGNHRKLQLNELNELCDQAYENCLIYKERTKKLHDSKIKNHIFSVGDRVLLFNSHLKIFLRKLKTHWSGPLTITKVFPYGTVKISQPDGLNFKVNGHRVKHYFRGDVSQLVVPDL
uniref:Reverse transcriptase domain-containing protein n=1 Tax=Tanacetum cinerariifolium TaxID=118510 RepID=A0A699H1Y9_TANCI|nr:reverse transcriptase domain-containing protein [Tanacetum cinerariifolium]